MNAGERGNASGGVVRLWNGRVACLAGVVVTGEADPGVVVLATGTWFDSDAPGVPGSSERHGNLDVRTADAGTSRPARGSTSGSAVVDAERVDPTTAPGPWPFVQPETADPAAASARRRPAPR
ncbi:hypothetical protein P1P68_00305 [Streptomyces scabiei]|uniref:hypothetical protein n=1 Tax=Streptomyces scabiei TaxID=1930 RepID=UPI002990247E|nr:hypothetical protein [Streptomyces scabiei]MDW8803291.1 hypothetical protein [Streptomyces scabiei]